MHGGDDLAGDFVLDVLSDGEDYEAVFSDNGPSEDNTSPGSPSPTEIPQKKRKRREKEKERKAKRRKLVEASEPIEDSVADRSPGELSNYLSSLQAKSASKLSSLELEDILISELSIIDTQAWTGPRTLDHLVDFIIKVLPTLHVQFSKKPKNNGSPALLFIAGAALRVADVTRVLKDKKLRGKMGGEVAKLFAKHCKLAEHVAYLKRTKITAAVGTPGRIGKLLRETDALSVSALSHIILDVTHRDPKKRNLFDIPETRDEVLQSVLAAPQVLQGIKGGKIRVVFF
ncbi:U3-containing 90S pre-ribosomal complex subunit-domain containing protein [Amanita rubescens]|nr:U3-containing 90S pre-ribosomal complex subunit-domain containing protein [Amanita rubescens]